MRPIRLAAAIAALFLTAGAAQAQDRAPCGAGMVCASDPASVVRAMEKAGLKPHQLVDNEGDPMIESQEAAYHFDVYFYGCEQHKNCDSLRFQVSFKKEAENTAELANKWNAGKRFLQASVPADGRFVVAYDVATIGGVGERNFADVLDWWQSMLGELGEFFQKELNLKPAG
ncbi:MAG: YbjN domain-containing protein [Pseudomonadota bacterium]